MKKIFVTKETLSLKNGGYLVAGDDNIPVFNQKFVALQNHAEWVVTFAEKAKDKDFVGKVPDTVQDVVNEVRAVLNNKTVKYVDSPEKVNNSLSEKLQKEALNFIAYQAKKTRADKINAFLQQFNIIKEFEDFGLYFEEDICKLDKIYTIEEIVKAVTEVIDLID